MLTIGLCIGSEKLNIHLKNAKTVLLKYPLLNDIFKNFTDPSFNDINNQNTVFRKCIIDTLESNIYLQGLEKKISDLKANGKILLKTVLSKIKTLLLN